jgi:cephalosporin hydroxylase
MRLTIDTEARTLTVADGAGEHALPLYGRAAFERLSREWVRVGWALRYSYQFTWLGRPIIQMPEDMVRTQEAVFRVRPDVIVETGVAHGGSLVFYASLCQLLGHGRVVGVDVTIRPENRRAIEAHDLAHRITLVEGDSVAPEVVARVAGLIRPGQSVMVLLDSNHSRAHVLRELEAYGPLVTPGSYLVATDGVMRDLSDVPGGRPEWGRDNPAEAAREFLARHTEFVPETPAGPFRESELRDPVTHWPCGWLRRVVPAAAAA